MANFPVEGGRVDPEGTDGRRRVVDDRSGSVAPGATDTLDAASLARVLALSPFREMDPTRFPRSRSLAAILQDHTTLSRFRRGDILVRAGDYGHSAFLLLSGAIRVVRRPGLPESLLGRAAPPRRHWSTLLAQPFRRVPVGEVREPVRDPGRGRGAGSQPATTIGADSGTIAGAASGLETRREAGNRIRISVKAMEHLLAHHETATLGPGEMFGEVGALSRFPRNVSVLADTDCEILEIGWQALRDLRRYDPPFRDRLDRLYRERSIGHHLRQSRLFSHLDETVLGEIEAAVRFASYGEWNWNADHREESRRSHTERLAAEPLIVREGDPATDLILVRSGFARISQRFNHGHWTIGFLGWGRHFGLAEILGGQESGETLPYQYSLRALGYVHVLRVPAPLVAAHLLPALPASKRPLPPAVSTGPGRERSAGKGQLSPALPTGPGRERFGNEDSGILEFLVDHRFINGTASLVIHLGRCRRCDRCLLACAQGHGGNPRFLRQGPRHGPLMVARGCMHCMDPVCLIGCPTGAIHRHPRGGEVIVHEGACIGCGSCAEGCPYEAIRLVEILHPDGSPQRDPENGLAILKATKCDLCLGQWGGPACQRACPANALLRVDMGNTRAFRRWLEA
ncbi:MAG: cyclic nucleotide-binding domain-containing protein [Magnetococcales bacterium]|nr:cyclic nucleotide-binding domain-containing protein [Magnetococcales bacterium]